MPGRGRPPVNHAEGHNKPKNAWNQRPTDRERNNKSKDSGGNKRSGERKFEDACLEIQQSVERHIALNQELEEEEEEEEELEEDQVLERVLDKYDQPELGRTRQFLQDAFKKGALVCVICIENIRHSDPIWNCTSCYTSFHVSCIHKWTKDSLFLQAETLEQKGIEVDKKSLKWCCPKCRSEYSQSVVPSTYFCFCGKQKDPQFDPWLIPHSCGGHCGKPLQPECGHVCLLLCHPGPCPPCPKTVRNTCHCGKQTPQLRRCASKHWSCSSPCGRLLACGQHTCETPCHAGDCAPCPRTSRQKCQCGRSVEMRACADPTWQCQQICKRSFSCGHHNCQVVCHEGSCGDCPMSGLRQCPCGKSTHNLPCTTDVPNCGDTCAKLLTCGLHYCGDRCHKGACPTCLQFLEKSCRCGGKRKEMACSKELFCETKCKNMRDCGRHQCNKKCCIGDCPSCEVTCGKTLMCKNHKCESRCHPGPCYPCPVTHQISCFCKTTTITVPCGREKITKPPNCNKTCNIPPNCHHPTTKKHKCHMGNCPRCQFVCDNALSCGHNCPKPCHDNVPVKVVDNRVRAGPWEKAAAARIEIQKQSCPPCLAPVPNSCRGLHETPDWPCSEIRPYSCGRLCGRSLKCTNHTCEKECHEVGGVPVANNSTNDTNKAGTNCTPCERPCSKPRPEGCSHICKQFCHPGECPQCKENVKLMCHCTLCPLYIKCDTLRAATNEEKEDLLSCKNPCNKLISCGHWCQLICHTGECSDTSDCKKRVPVRCPCKRIRKDIPCNLITTGQGNVECNQACEEKMQEKLQAQRAEEERIKEEEELKRKRELEAFERKFDGKRRKNRQRNRGEIVEELSFWEKRKYYIVALLIILIAITSSYVLL